MALRKYTVDEVRRVAEEIGLDPDYFESLYKQESSYGNKASALGARQVTKPKSKKQVLIRGPFQLQDETFVDTARKHGIKFDSMDDPDTYLYVAAWRAKDTLDEASGDYAKAGRIWHAGSDLPRAGDEQGKSTGAFGTDIHANVQFLKAAAPMANYEPPTAPSPNLGPRFEDAPSFEPRYALGGLTGSEDRLQPALSQNQMEPYDYTGAGGLTPFITQQARARARQPAIPGLNPQLLALLQRLQANAPERDSLGLPRFDLPHLYRGGGGGLPTQGLPADLPLLMMLAEGGGGGGGGQPGVNAALPSATGAPVTTPDLFGAGDSGSNLVAGMQYADDADATAYFNRLFDEVEAGRKYGGSAAS